MSQVKWETFDVIGVERGRNRIWNFLGAYRKQTFTVQYHMRTFRELVLAMSNLTWDLANGWRLFRPAVAAEAVLPDAEAAFEPS